MKSKKVLNEKNVILFLFPAVPPEIFVQRRSRYFSELSDFWGLFFFFKLLCNVASPYRTSSELLLHAPGVGTTS